MRIRRPQSIESKGLQKYLDDPVQVGKHQGHGYKDFHREAYKRHGMTKKELAQYMGVSEMTVNKWLTILELERRG